MFKVVEYSETDVEAAMLSLAECASEQQLTPACIVGVLNGGKLPAQHFAAQFPTAQILFFKLQRQTSGSLKSSILSKVKKLPRPIVNILRSLEMSLSIYIRRKSVLVDEDATSYFKEHLRLEKITEQSPIFLVDDAIDSGATLATLVESLKAAGVKRERIKVVAIVHTLSQPLITADFVKERGVLIRFPWSGDA